MELVYLWVEEYKNIKRQGFNFSPRFRCEFKDEYDENDNLKDDCKMIIDENKDYISIFPKNVNITAIVGENGSGKSSLTKFTRLSMKSFYGQLRKNERLESNLIIIYDKEKDKFLCLDYNTDCTNINKDLNIEYIRYKENNYENIEFLNKTIFPMLDYSLTYDRLIHSYNPILGEEIRFANFPKKNNSSIYLYSEENDVVKSIVQNYDSLNKNDHWGLFEEFFHPEYIVLHYDLERFRTKDISEYLNDKIRDENFISIDFFKKINNNLDDEIPKEPERRRGAGTRYDRYRSLKNCITGKDDIIETLCKKNISEIIVDKNGTYSRKYNIFKFKISDITEEEIEYLIELVNSDIFGIDIIDKNEKKFNILSFGEQQLLKVLNIIYNLASNDDTDNLIVFLDEIDIGFHPDWQKKVVKYILGITELLLEKEFHFIISAHSPFVLSDIPKQNIVFLNKDEKGLSRDVSSDVNIQSFGANIHTLLSHGFFMKDGLIGDFAKSKIDKAIEYLNQKVLTKDEIDYCENIIVIIGEPIIKRQLQKMLDSKRLKKVDKIDDIEKQIAYLSQELESLKNGNN